MIPRQIYLFMCEATLVNAPLNAAMFPLNAAHRLQISADQVPELLPGYLFTLFCLLSTLRRFTPLTHQLHGADVAGRRRRGDMNNASQVLSADEE